MNFFKISLLSLGFLALPMAANATTIDFEDLTNDGVNYTLFGDTVNSGGFTFTSQLFAGDDQALASWADGSPAYYTGSTALFANYGDDVVEMTESLGNTFSLTSIDAADVYQGIGGELVTLTGIRADSSTVTESFTVLGGGLQTFALSNMTDLVSLTWEDGNGTVQVDNLVTAPVPEPASMAILGMGVVALVRRRRAR